MSEQAKSEDTTMSIWQGSVGRGRWLPVLVAAVIAVLVVGGVVVLPRGGQAAAQEQPKPGKPGAGASVPVQVAPVQGGVLRQKTTLTGDFQPQETVQVTARVQARVVRLPVEVGQAVNAGDVLVELDRVQLAAALAQAQAQLAAARAGLKRLEAGARAEDVAAAEAAARQAAERFAQAEAQAGSVRAQDVATAQAALALAEARLRQVTQGATEAEVAQAQAALGGARARYEQVLAGPRPQDIDVAAQALAQARENRARLESQLATVKEQARLALEQAASAVRAAQATYGAAKLVYEEAVRTGKDPNIPEIKGAPKGYRDLTDAKLRQYKAAYEQAEQALRQAEQALEQRSLAYEDARKQEILTLQQADAAVRSAQATLDKLEAGATQEEIDAARATVEQAQATLDRVLQPAREADVAAAQAAVDQARAVLARIQASPTDVGVAQAALAQARAVAQKAAAPYLPEDLEAARAQVQQAEAGVQLAEANLRDATIVAPFGGVIAAKNASAGSLAGPGTILLELISPDVRGFFTIEEAQVGQVKVGQPATLTTTAYPGETFPGTVSVINPSASASTRSFGLRVTPRDPQGKLKAGMFAQAELVTRARAEALVVPEGAVLTRDGQAIVFVVAGGTAQRREVATGLRADGQVEITGGLSAGEPVVVVGQTLLTDGDAVTVR